MKRIFCCLLFVSVLACAQAQPYQVRFWIATTTLASANYQSVQDAITAQSQGQCAVREILLNLPKDRGCAFYVPNVSGGQQQASALATDSDAAPAGSDTLSFTVNHPGNLRLDVGLNWTGAAPGDQLKNFWCIVPFNQTTLIAVPAKVSPQAAGQTMLRRFYFLQMSGQPGLNDVTTQYQRQQLFNAHRMMMGPR